MMSYSYDAEDPSAVFEINEQRDADLAKRDYAQENKKIVEILVEIISTRIHESPRATISVFFAYNTSTNKYYIGYFLEPGGPSTKQRDMDKRIPEGNYVMSMSYSSVFHKDLYLLTNEDVEGRGIRLHTGNFHYDTSGCLIPGTDYELVNGEYKVTGSGEAYKELMNLSQGQDMNLSIYNCITNYK